MFRRSQELEARLKILENFATAYKQGSEEWDTLKLAAEALLFIDQKGYQEEFNNYVSEAQQELTDEQIAYLKSIGCMPH